MRFFTLALFAVLCAISYAQDCALIVPNDPLTATGLATPYQLANIAGNPNSGACTMADAANVGAFVQGAFIDLDTGAVKVYNPLVIDAGTQPAIAPTPPVLPANSVVALWFGFNGVNLFLQSAPNGNGLTAGNCVNGLGTSIFGQFSYCNAPAFFDAANNAIQEGNLIIPPLGVAIDGKPCPTVRDFFVIDQDQSDNVVTQYLTVTNAAGQVQLAQDTPANRNQLGTNTIVTNASDNRLVNLAIDVALGCTGWVVPDAADAGNTQMVGALPLNELLAAYRQAAPMALVPENDPMAQLNGASSVDKVNLYRMGVNQPLITDIAEAPALDYCQKFAATAFSRIQANQGALSQLPSPDGNPGTLLTFLVQTRFSVSISAKANGGLGCTTMGVANPFVNGLQNGQLNQTLVFVLAGTGGALALLGIGAAIFVVAQRRKSAMTAANNFMAL